MIGIKCKSGHVFSECNCEHCQSLEHKFEDLIEEIKNE